MLLRGEAVCLLVGVGPSGCDDDRAVPGSLAASPALLVRHSCPPLDLIQRSAPSGMQADDGGVAAAGIVLRGQLHQTGEGLGGTLGGSRLRDVEGEQPFAVWFGSRQWRQHLGCYRSNSRWIESLFVGELSAKVNPLVAGGC